MIRSISRSSVVIFLTAATPFVLAEDAKEKAKPEAAKFEITKNEQTLLDLLNKERADKKLPPLRPHPLLFKAGARTFGEHGQTAEDGTRP